MIKEIGYEGQNFLGPKCLLYPRFTVYEGNLLCSLGYAVLSTSLVNFGSDFFICSTAACGQVRSVLRTYRQVFRWDVDLIAYSRQENENIFANFFTGRAISTQGAPTRPFFKP